MSLLIKAITECLLGQPDHASTTTTTTSDEKSKIAISQRMSHTASEIATDIVHALYIAEKPGRKLKCTLNDIVSECGWTEHLATAILEKLEAALKTAAQMGQVMKEAFNKATEEAYGFAGKHPVYATIIALGILVVLAPWVIEALGFGEIGPIEGKVESIQSPWGL